MPSHNFAGARDLGVRLAARAARLHIALAPASGYMPTHTHCLCDLLMGLTLGCQPHDAASFSKSPTRHATAHLMVQPLFFWFGKFNNRGCALSLILVTL